MITEPFKRNLSYLSECSNVLCDFDEPLIKSIETFFNFIVQTIGSKRTYEEFDTYMDFEKFFGISKKEFFLIETEYFLSEKYQALTLDQEALAVLAYIKTHPKCNYIDILSARHVDHYHATHTKIVQYAPALFNDVSHIRGGDYKDIKCKSEYVAMGNKKYSIFVEDSGQTATAMALKFTGMCIFVPKRRWNKYLETDLPSNVMRVDGWQEIGDIVSRHLL